MPLVRYQSPDESAFVVFDQSRFRVDHGVFYFRPEAIDQRISEILETQRHWDLVVMKLVQENRRLQACREWLVALSSSDDEVVVPDLPHEPAIDLVANRLIGDGNYVSVECLLCLKSYSPLEVHLDPWDFEEEGTTLRGRKTICPEGHTIHALRDSIDAIDLELDD